MPLLLLYTNVISQDGEKWYRKTAVKLACKAVFLYHFTSDGNPMLLEWHLFRHSRRLPPGTAPKI